jgi:hypothetical protein
MFRFMKTLLRKIPDRQYLQSPDQWTTNPREAFDFRSMSQAIEFVEREGYRNVEVAFEFRHPHRFETVRLDTLEGFEQ